MDAVTSYETMLPVFLMDLPGVSDILAKQALQLAGRKFCLDSRLYTKKLTAVNVVSGTSSYDLSSLLPASTKVIDFYEARTGATATTDTTAPVDKSKYIRTDESTFKFVQEPTSSIADGLVVTVILRPTVASTGLETWFYDRYFEAIVAYGRYYLLTLSKTQPWHDPERGKMYLEQYAEYLSYYNEDVYRPELDVTAYSAMLPWLVSDFPKTDKRILNQQLALAGRKFCIDTKLYQETLTAINVVSGTREYDMSSLLPTDTKIIEIVQAWTGTDAETDTTAPMDRIDFKLIDETTFKFTTTPTSSISSGLVVKVSLRPQANAVGIATWFYDRYFEPILAYSHYLLYAMLPETLKLAEYHLAKYQEYVRDYLNIDLFIQEVDITTYSTMMPLMQSEFPDVDEKNLNYILGLAGRQFCLDTELYEKTLEAVDVVADTRDYDLADLLPTDTEIIRFGDVRYGTTATTDTTTPYSTANYSLYEQQYFRFRTAPTTSITDGLVCVVVLRPIVSSTGLETWFYDRYYEAIISYAKYYLYNMHNAAWSSEKKAKEHSFIYNSYVGRYKREKYMQYKNGLFQVDRDPARF
jgi:hypothetical protein